jgi:aryl-alcohol dehydrogenase-like predicted oxidoreductase
MEYRQLGRSGLRVSTMTLGTTTFGGTGWASVVGQTSPADLTLLARHVNG